MSDDTRREALARTLCARLHDERLRVDSLEVIDRVVTLLLDDDHPMAPLLDRLANDRYNEDQGDEREQTRRRWFNKGSDHARALLLANVAVGAEEQPIDLRLKNALIEGAEVE